MLVVAVVMSGGIQLKAQAGRGNDTPPVPLKVTVTISRWEGEKRTASLPFVLWVNTGGQGNVQMGSDVPVPTVGVKEGATTPTQSFSYRTLGTNINCKAEIVSEGLYRLTVDVNDAQVFRGNSASSSYGPIYQNFRSSNSPMLRDGQTVQFAVATDKTSGEVIKLDVMLNLVK
jgi:hypothetical protein